jgi:adenine-specific DNA-methyltransferase
MRRQNQKRNKRSIRRAKPKLQRQNIRKSPPKRKRRARPRIQLLLHDAFDFLKKIKPGSVDLIVSSPPYCMGKEYEKSLNVEDFIAAHELLAPLLARVLRRGGSLCWQVGHHVKKGVVTPLDAIVYPIFARQNDLQLRNRIVWTFGHGVHASKRFSGRHETILWFTKGDDYIFNLDAVRIPQKYPGKKYYKGPLKGEFSGNPKGKNPSDVWEIPNVKSRHVEKTSHPCQFPVALVQRLIKALTRRRANVVDPFMESGSVALAAAIEGRSFRGCDIKQSYVLIARGRVENARKGQPKYRPLERPIYVPSATDSVAIRPKHFLCSQP